VFLYRWAPRVMKKKPTNKKTKNGEQVVLYRWEHRVMKKKN